ncbi:DUF1989 domain-containing protein [Alphaproteobacteria bacterium LSUCC0684]
MSLPLYDPAFSEGVNASLTAAVSPDGTPETGMRYRIPPRCGVAVRLKAGQLLRVENTHGTQVCDFWAYLGSDMGQFLSMSHCRTWLQSVFPKVGDKLVTNRRQPLLEIECDTSPGVHDTIMSCCDWPRYQLLGCDEYHDNCADNLRMALKAIGLTPPLVPDPFNLWMNIPITDEGRTSFEPTVSSPGDVVGLRALEDSIAVMSACPQDKNPINGRDAVPTELHFTVEA